MEPTTPVIGEIYADLADEPFWWWRRKYKPNGRTATDDKQVVERHIQSIWDAAAAEQPDAAG
ncbi:MAG: hypothetical protein WAV90_26365 [Gordonia amarae]